MRGRDWRYHAESVVVCVLLVVCLGGGALLVDPGADPSGRVLLVVTCVCLVVIVVAGRAAL